MGDICIREGAWCLLKFTKVLELNILVALTGFMIGATLQLIDNNIEPKVWGPALVCCVIAFYHTAYTLVLRNICALIKKSKKPNAINLINCLD